jgi:hypothetical protein
LFKLLADMEAWIGGTARDMGRKDDDEGLVESQSVNAGGPIDAAVPEHEPPTPDATPQETHGPDGTTGDEMVGLPDQKPGYPGQQRSVETG